MDPLRGRISWDGGGGWFFPSTCASNRMGGLHGVNLAAGEQPTSPLSMGPLQRGA
eukprot:m.85452 g.85452  ORF g.85452 m.85452 type:complete len:55 (-) comp19781_c1_seq1:72-236(-)